MENFRQIKGNGKKRRKKNGNLEEEKMEMRCTR